MLHVSSCKLLNFCLQVGSLQSQLQQLQEVISSERESFSNERQSFTAELAGRQYAGAICHPLNIIHGLTSDVVVLASGI